MANKTINLKPYHCEQKRDGDGWVWEFYGATEGGKRIKVRLHMGIWWIRFLARDLWGVVKRQKEDVAEAEEALKSAQS